MERKWKMYGCGMAGREGWKRGGREWKKRCTNIVESTSAQKIYRIVWCRKGKGNVEINCFRAWEQNSAKLFDVQKSKTSISEGGSAGRRVVTWFSRSNKRYFFHPLPFFCQRELDSDWYLLDKHWFNEKNMQKKEWEGISRNHTDCVRYFDTRRR